MAKIIKKATKRGQTEAIGLLVIVVLFVVIIMFYLAFSLRPEAVNTLKENVQVDYMLNAILKYTPECSNEVTKTMKDIINSYDFEANNVICGRPCKDLIKDESKKIIELADDGKQKYGYDFEIKWSKNGKENMLNVKKCESNNKITYHKFLFRGPEPSLSICIFK